MGRQTSIIRKRIEKAFYSPADFLVVEDEKRPSTWRIRIGQNGIPSERLMRNAYAYLTKGFAGRVYKGPQKEQAMTKLRSMFKRMNKPTPGGKQQTEGARAAESAVTPELADWVMNTDQTLEDFNEGVGYVYVDGDVPGVPWGVTSFGDLLAADQAKSHANEVMILAYQLTRLVENIVNSPDIPDKLGALTNLVNEFVTLAGDAMAPAESEAKPLSTTSEASPVASGDGEQLAESAGGVLELAEAADAPTSGVPLTMKVGIIRPGWGNERDSHYYPAEVLKRDAHVFEGAKMYETDHKEAERSTRTWVSTIDSIEGFAADGSPIAKVIVHDPNFAERLRALKTAGKLAAMECSILATGRAKPGQVDGKQANVVEAITAAHAVDWVTRAGAGGRALEISESAAEEPKQSGFTDPTQPAEPQPATFDADPADTPAPEDPTTAAGDGGSDAAPADSDAAAPAKPGDVDGDQAADAAAADTQLADTKAAAASEAASQPTLLNELAVRSELDRTRLPMASRDRLAERSYSDLAELGKAIDAEIAYVKELTGSGQPVMQGAAIAPVQTVVTAELAAANAAAINKRYFGH